MKKSKWAILLPALFLAVSVSAQSKITDNTVPNTDNPAALLDLQSGQRGFLPPRVQLSNTTTWAPLTGSPVAGMTVFNPAAAGSGPTAVTTGYYYNNGTNWIRLLDAISGSWSLLGNAGTVDGTNFIGTTDAVPLNLRVANVSSGRIESNSATANTAFGFDDLPINTGTDNTAFGYVALSANNTGNFNTAMGWRAEWSSSNTSYNSGFGVQALKSNSSGMSNTAIGVNCLIINNSGSNNTALGAFNSQANQTGSGNTILGAYADAAVDGLNNATAIGFQAKVSQSNSLILGGTGTYAVNVGIGNTAPNSTLQVTGSVSASIRTVTTTTTLGNTDFSVLANGAFTIYLPDATTCTGRIYKVLNIGSATITIAPVVTTQRINSTNASVTRTAWTSYNFQSNGVGWYTIP